MLTPAEKRNAGSKAADGGSLRRRRGKETGGRGGGGSKREPLTPFTPPRRRRSGGGDDDAADRDDDDENTPLRSVRDPRRRPLVGRLPFSPAPGGNNVAGSAPGNKNRNLSPKRRRDALRSREVTPAYAYRNTDTGLLEISREPPRLSNIVDGVACAAKGPREGGRTVTEDASLPQRLRPAPGAGVSPSPGAGTGAPPPPPPHPALFPIALNGGGVGLYRDPREFGTNAASGDGHSRNYRTADWRRAPVRTHVSFPWRRRALTYDSDAAGGRTGDIDDFQSEDGVFDVEMGRAMSAAVVAAGGGESTLGSTLGSALMAGVRGEAGSWRVWERIHNEMVRIAEARQARLARAADRRRRRGKSGDESGASQDSDDDDEEEDDVVAEEGSDLREGRYHIVKEELARRTGRIARESAVFNDDDFDFALVLQPKEVYSFWADRLDFRAETIGADFADEESGILMEDLLAPSGSIGAKDTPGGGREGIDNDKDLLKRNNDPPGSGGRRSGSNGENSGGCDDDNNAAAILSAIATPKGGGQQRQAKRLPDGTWSGIIVDFSCGGGSQRLRTSSSATEPRPRAPTETAAPHPPASASAASAGLRSAREKSPSAVAVDAGGRRVFLTRRSLFERAVDTLTPPGDDDGDGNAGRGGRDEIRTTQRKVGTMRSLGQGLRRSLSPVRLSGSRSTGKQKTPSMRKKRMSFSLSPGRRSVTPLLDGDRNGRHSHSRGRATPPSTTRSSANRRRWGSSYAGQETSTPNLMTPPVLSLPRSNSIRRNRQRTPGSGPRQRLFSPPVSDKAGISGDGDSGGGGIGRGDLTTLSPRNRSQKKRNRNSLEIEDIPTQVVPRGIAARTNGMEEFLSALKRGVVVRRHRPNAEAAFVKLFSTDGGDTVR